MIDKTQPSNDERIDKLEKSVIQLQQHVMHLNQLALGQKTTPPESVQRDIYDPHPHSNPTITD